MVIILIMIYTKEMILEKFVQRNAKWVERALVVLYARQTSTEQNVEETIVHNNAGFQPADANFFSSCAKQVLAGRRLSDKQIYCLCKLNRKGVPRIAKYRGQLLDIIAEKQGVGA